MPKPKIRHQLFVYIVSVPGQQIIIDEETDKLYNTCTGVNIVLGDDSAKFSTLQLDINNVEIAPENWEVLRWKFREQSPMGYDYHTLNEPAGGSKIKGKFIDKGAFTTYPYLLSISLRLENLGGTTKTN